MTQLILDKDIVGNIGLKYDGMIPDIVSAGGDNLVVDAHLAGVGQERATLAVHVTNKASNDVDIEQLYELPWFAKPLIHTLQVQLDGVLLESIIMQ